jgi:hypothetical protein
VPLVEQEHLILPEHLSSPPVFSEVHVTWSLVLCECDSDYPFGIFKLFLRQIGGFVRVLRFTPTIKLTPRYNWNFVESGIKHHKPKPKPNPTSLYVWCLLTTPIKKKKINLLVHKYKFSNNLSSQFSFYFVCFPYFQSLGEYQSWRFRNTWVQYNRCQS